MSGGAKGIGLGIDFAIGNQYKRKGGKSYIDPAVLSSVVSVISTYGKTNEDADRSILKDKTGKGNDFKLFNFSFSEASGYGEYKTDFNKNWALEMAAITGNQIVTFNRGDYKAGVFFLKIPTSLKVNIASFTVDVDFKSSKEDAAPYYYYWDTTGKRNQIRLVKGKNVLPTNYASNSTEGTTGSGFHDNFCDIVTIKQIPDFEGWLCTDGVDDIIESVKPVSEMLEGSNEITVVSIIHQISQIPGSEVNKGLNNQISYYDSPTTRGYLRNNVKDVGKTGICGYTFNGTAHSVINNILGDKNDYIAVRNNEGIALNGVFSVCGYKNYFGELKELSSIAYAGGFIANKVLTTDEINQIIAYFNLDRPGQIIKPQLYCNIKKQGITNENHTEFNDQLIDFVGGHNIQLNNIGWKGESGIIDGALYLDGISDFGKATGLPVLKDYTVVADRKILGNNEGGTLSKSYSAGNGAFIFESGSVNYSFGTGASGSGIQSKRMLSYLSKYIYNGNPVQAGAGIDSDSMWLGTLRDNDTRFAKLALWSLMLFPYSLSEFLLERQLRKYKAGTLYPDMIEFRPVIKSNIPYSSVSYSVNPGEYITEGSTVTITITLSNASDKLIGVSSNAISDISISGDNGVYEVTGKVTKSPQKISIVISSYLTMLGNDTLISNETLIKNK